MKRKICNCKCPKFEASKTFVTKAIIDSNNTFFGGKTKLDEDDYSDNRQYDKYRCIGCGRVYKNLNDLHDEYSEEIFITEEKNEYLQKILNLDYDEYPEYIKNNDVKEDDTLFLETAIFENGFQADIKVCTGQSNAYVDCVLFDTEGHELGCCAGETLLGEVSFEYDNNIFFVDVKLK